MPRPPSKRSRPAPQTLTVPKGVPQRSSRRENGNPPQAWGSPSERNSDVETATQSRLTTQVSGISRQVRDQTPDAQELAIESSPMGERGATGSRPPTRSRGYSSTLSVAGRKAETGPKIPGTPAFESSILSNFRRRPRQPSILHMMQAEDGSSDFDDDDFLGGFSPEDESTPINISRGKSIMMQSAVASSPSQISLPSSSGSRKRRRSSKENANPEVPFVGTESDPANSAPSPSHNHEQELHASEESPHTRASFATLTQEMALPLSSSLPPSPASAAILSSTQPLEGYRNPVRGSDNQIRLPTTALQDKFLPRRRQQRRRLRHIPNVDDSSTSSEDDWSISEQGEDEISFLPDKTTSWSQRRRPAKAKTRVARKTAKAYEHQADCAEKNRSIAVGSKEAKAPNGSMHDLGVDKENEKLNTSSPLSSPPGSEAFDAESLPDKMSVNFTSDELRAQARKFAEVDNWEMEFEDLPASQNSPG